MRTQLTIRPAKQSDKKAILEFCQHTFDWGDYVPHVWEQWVKEKHARLFTALIGSQPVGMMRVSIIKPGEAWLQAARTHPDHRRRGIATALTTACLEWAKGQGARTVRLATDSDNQAAQKTLQKLGFTQISDFLIMKCEKPQPEKPLNANWAQESETERIWKFLKNSDIFAQSNGLYTILFTWISLDKKDLSKFVSSKKAIVQYENDVVNGLVLIDETVRNAWPEKPFQTCYIDGDRKAVIDMMRFFKTYSCQQGVTNCYAFACNTPSIADALAEAGFSREEPTTELVYKRNLIPKNPNRKN